jgi:hypothetical protein
LSGLREDQGAPGTAEVLSATGVHHSHLKGGSVALHPMRGAHKREVAHPQGMAGSPMGLITVGVPGKRAEVLLMMLMERRVPRIGVIGALVKKMATAAALVLSVGMTGALLMMMMRIRVLLEAASQTKSRSK